MLFEGVNIYNKVFSKLKKIGIAGTNGKTTTAKILCQILKEQGIHIGFISKDEISINEERIENEFKDLNEEKLSFFLDEIVKNDVEIVIVEVDDRCLEKNIFQGIDFDIIIYTSIEIEYMNSIQSIEFYMKLQKSLLKYLSDNGIIIINADDQNSFKLLENIKDRLIITYGLSSKATITASSIDIAPIQFNCCIQRGMTSLNNMDIEPMEFPINMDFIGIHNVYNALASIAIVLIYGILPENIMKAVKKFKSIKRRMYKINNDQYQIIDDRCQNPASFEAVFEAVQSIDYEKLYIVNSIIGSKGIELNKRNAKIIANWMRGLKSAKLITTCSIDVVDGKDKVLEDERIGFYEVMKENGIFCDHKDRLEDALAIALSHASKNDLILLLGGSGMDEGENLIMKLLKGKN
ncbi:Mur ligase family protein [Crassaminicella indica]|uniref:UDP-N-acetylmuramyl peptide synthase n=1 Tax=Crassaminicella indica TaxID=2855394 RepID=A0ABX8R947_9CLOT|nr:Mur ligase family protein [Crassaminicella indica]QXM05562.1 UDP-N-acetylmuramyl peptide synthase [Crassaminicella indica]